jgi:iron-sulfur cluster assembly protein
MALLDIESDLNIETTKTDEITMSEAAADAVREIVAKKELAGYGLRVYVAGGGCSGYQYGMALENNIRDTDLVFTHHDVQVIIDEMSINYLRGSNIDYVDELMGSGFQINNPNAVAACGCGSSFRTEEDSNPSASSGSCC